MSGARARRAALAYLAQQTSDATLLAALSGVVERCDDDLLQFLFEAGLDASLVEREICRRAVPIALQYAAIQLCDDLSDGDCDYLSEGERLGPLLLMSLQNLSTAASLDARVTRASLTRVCTRLARVAAAQHEELATRAWTFARSRRTASVLTGEQLAAYLELLWDATPLSKLARAVGSDLGLLAHVSRDALTGDPRFWSLAPRERTKLQTEARAAARRLLRHRLDSVTRSARALLKSLRALPQRRTAR